MSSRLDLPEPLGPKACGATYNEGCLESRRVGEVTGIPSPARAGTLAAGFVGSYPEPRLSKRRGGTQVGPRMSKGAERVRRSGKCSYFERLFLHGSAPTDPVATGLAAGRRESCSRGVRGGVPFWNSSAGLALGEFKLQPTTLDAIISPLLPRPPPSPTNSRAEAGDLHSASWQIPVPDPLP